MVREYGKIGKWTMTHILLCNTVAYKQVLYPAYAMTYRELHRPMLKIFYLFLGISWSLY